MNWAVPQIWKGGDVWILGGGPSVPKQFGIPDEVVQKVIKGEANPAIYSPYMSFLHNKHVIGINVAYMIGDWIDIVFFGDDKFFLKHKKELAQFSGLKACCHTIVMKYKWVKYLQKEKNRPLGISSNPRMVSWNHNSGSAAISVAAHAGAKRIILLGFDMKLSDQKRQHWHDEYKRGVIDDDRKKRHLPFKKHMQGFDQIAKDAKRMGIEIINVSPDSTIKEFPKISLKELIL